jgi:hypothetical protein
VTKPNDPRIVCVVWIKREDYSVVSSDYGDPRVPCENWEEWEKRAKRVEAGLKGRGLVIERMFIDSKTLFEWRQEEGERDRFGLLH